jgi:hypothetical protein
MSNPSSAAAAVAFLLTVTPLGQPSPARPKMEVFKTSTCGCCSKWIDHMKAARFDVRFVDMPQAELDKVKARYGVPTGASSCHTALIGGYVVEGHVPASDVKRLLTERPAFVGLAVPAMPAGSPGMEVPGIIPPPYNVVSFDKQGRVRVFSTQKPPVSR